MGASVGPKISKINNIVFSYSEKNRKRRDKFAKITGTYDTTTDGGITTFLPPANHRMRRVHNDGTSAPTTMQAEGSSMSIWVRRLTDSGIDGYDPLASWTYQNNRWKWLGFFDDEAWKLHYSMGHFNSNSGSAASNQTILDYTWTGTVGTWFNLISTYDKSTRLASLYKNGILIGSDTRNNYGDLMNPGAGKALKLYGTRGGNYNGAPNGETGDRQLDSCKIWDIALSAAEVKREFNRFKSRYGLSTPITNLATPSILSTEEAVGQQAFTTPGSTTWTVPAGVTSICVVCIGGGGGGYGAGSEDNGGGGGGGLGYKNNITVASGSNYTIGVGAGGVGGGADGGDSYFSNTSLVKGGGGTSTQTGTGGGAAGSYVGDGGGNGGVGGSASGYAGGGGGAGGYSGNGGTGALGSSNGNAGVAGAGGGGGGGASGHGGGGGGGVGILGEGSSGIAGSGNGDFGNGGSSGANGDGGDNGNPYGGGDGGNYGGGGGGGADGSRPNSSGGSGAVRIIWGSGRAFPSTNTQDL